MTAAPDIDWTTKPAIQTEPHHHFCSVLERGDIEKSLHSAVIDVYDAGIVLDGRKNRPRLVEVIAVGPGRWVPGGRQPREVEAGAIVYVKERTVPLRLHLRKQNHYYVPMDGIMAELDRVNVRIKPLGDYVMTREVEERHRVAVMGELPFHVAKTFGVEKKGDEADDIGCNKTRIEEVVAVGPGEFGGFIQTLRRGIESACEPEWVLENTPWYKTPSVKPGDLIAFTDMARPCEIVLAGKKYTLFTMDFSVCTVLDQAI
jgi:co-chaperonin GroES (HSP10)